MKQPPFDATRSQPAPVLSAGSIALSFTVAVLAVLAGCNWEPAPAPAPRVEAPRPTLLIVATGDTGGRLTATSCGVARPGGVDRRAALLEALPAGSNPIVLDAGGAASGDLPADRVTWAYLLRAEQALGTAAHNLGREELALAPEQLAKLAHETQIPWVSSNTRTAAKPSREKTGAARNMRDCYLTEPLRVVERGSATVVILGVVSPRAAREGIVIEEPATAVRTVLADYGWQQKRPAAIVVLADLEAEEIEPLAASLPPQTLLINRGAVIKSEQRELRRVAITQTPAAGEGAVVAELNLNSVTANDEPAQWTVTMPLLNATGKHPEFTPLLAAYQRELAQGDFTAHDTTWAARRGALPAPLKENMSARVGALAYAGSQHCRACHTTTAMQCDSAPHATAWQALVDRGQQHEARCQRCHTTGFNSGDQPGLARGFISARQTPQFTAVSCEACHGPSAAHAVEPMIPTPWVAKQSCTQCHDAEHSPAFEVNAAWQRIQHPPQPAADTVGGEVLGPRF